MTSKVIAVVGASRGIGKAIVLQLAKDKSNTVIALSRNLKQMQADYTQENVVTGQIDLASENLHQELELVLSTFPRVDILINNAGLLIKKPFLELTREDIDACYQVNSIGAIYATQYFVPKMLEHGGHILNISSMGAFQGSVKFPELSAYSTSKAGIASFTELFAEEYKETKIKMNCLCLGAVQTEMFEAAFPGAQAPLQPVEIAQFIVDFALKTGNYFNGKVLPVSISTP